MSHGSTDKCEPNLTPLLDLVLQLVMFFMLCANFVMEQTSDQVKLPEAIAAKALDKTEEDVFFLNINKDGVVVLTPDQQLGEQSTLENDLQVYNYMKQRADIDMRKTKKDKPQTVLILRIDRETRFEKTYGIMKACRKAMFEKVQLRVKKSGEE
jgi:biopolymer transport protein ExbD